MIPYGFQSIRQADIDAVVEVLGSKFLTQGPQIPAFEQKLVSVSGAEHAVAVNSATSALHIACLALGGAPGTRVWTSPITFVASANCARYCGADVDFVDVDATTGNMSIQSLRKKLEAASRSNTLPQILIPVHLSGRCCDMDEIYKLKKQYGFSIIEDASHALGGTYEGTPVGSCKRSEITVFSFHAVKILTTGEGGAAVTNRADLAETMRLLRTHGITREPSRFSNKNEGDWYYEQQMLGFNYRLTDFQAALGKSQLERLKETVKRRNELATRYHDLLKHLPLTLPDSAENSLSPVHLYIVQTKEPEVRKELFDFLRAAEIEAHVHYIPVHLQPYYQNLGCKLGDFPEAERYYAHILTLPLFPDMTEIEQDYVVTTIEKFFS